ncbi:MAG: hypothetical protein ACI9FE_000592, partial [Porticoccaceae bacterium]
SDNFIGISDSLRAANRCSRLPLLVVIPSTYPAMSFVLLPAVVDI